VFALVILVTLAAPAFSDDVTLTASAGTGVMYGLARELVYSISAFNGTTYLESELDWDIKPLYYTKAALSLGTPQGFVASLAVQMGIPAKTGTSTDSDWLNYDKYGDTSLTNYLHMDCITERAILLDAQVGWEFPLASWLSLQPYAAFQFMDFKWTGRDGYFQYPPNWFGGGATPPYPPASTQPKANEAGVGIIYEQTYMIPAAGFTAKFRAGDGFNISASFSFSPIVFCNDLDNHMLGYVTHDFYDYTRGGILVEPKVSLEWQVSGRVRFSLDVSYLHIEGLNGDTYKVTTGIGQDPNQAAVQSSGAGAAFDALDASLNITWVL
jgi:outer membrane protease